MEAPILNTHEYEVAICFILAYITNIKDWPNVKRLSKQWNRCAEIALDYSLALPKALSLHYNNNKKHLVPLEKRHLSYILGKDRLNLNRTWFDDNGTMRDPLLSTFGHLTYPCDRALESTFLYQRHMLYSEHILSYIINRELVHEFSSDVKSLPQRRRRLSCAWDEEAFLLVLRKMNSNPKEYKMEDSLFRECLSVLYKHTTPVTGSLIAIELVSREDFFIQLTCNWTNIISFMVYCDLTQKIWQDMIAKICSKYGSYWNGLEIDDTRPGVVIFWYMLKTLHLEESQGVFGQNTPYSNFYHLSESVYHDNCIGAPRVIDPIIDEYDKVKGKVDNLVEYHNSELLGRPIRQMIIYCKWRMNILRYDSRKCPTYTDFMIMLNDTPGATLQFKTDILMTMRKTLSVSYILPIVKRDKELLKYIVDTQPGFVVIWLMNHYYESFDYGVDDDYLSREIGTNSGMMNFLNYCGVGEGGMIPLIVFIKAIQCNIFLLYEYTKDAALSQTIITAYKQYPKIMMGILVKYMTQPHLASAGVYAFATRILLQWSTHNKHILDDIPDEAWLCIFRIRDDGARTPCDATLLIRYIVTTCERDNKRWHLTDQVENLINMTIEVIQGEGLHTVDEKTLANLYENISEVKKMIKS